MRIRKTEVTIGFFLTLCLAVMSQAQTTAFTYQGSLKDNGTPANGTFEMQFKLFDAFSGGFQIGPTINDLPVTTNQGVFSVRLDFGANALSGANRWLEIGIRRNLTEPYTTLSPREQLASAPYSVRTISAANADLATDSLKLGGYTADQYVRSTDLGAGFIRNQQAQQPASNFNISGNGSIGGDFAVGTATPAHRLAVGAAGPPWTGHAWTGSVELPNVGAIGWRPNTSNQSFGIGQTNWGLSFFRATSPLGTLGPDPTYAMNIDNNGNVGIGTLTPGATLDVTGTLRATSTSSTDLIVETTGGNSAAARFTMKSPGRSWVMGTTNNFADNQFYIADGNTIDARMTVQPSAGPISFPLGNVGIGVTNPTSRLQVAGDIAVSRDVFKSLDRGGLIKFMLFVDPFGNIVRCYNSFSGATSGGCGFSAQRINGGTYRVDFGHKVSDRFFSVVPRYDGNDRTATLATSEDTAEGTFLTPNQIMVTTFAGSRLNSYFYVVVY